MTTEIEWTDESWNPIIGCSKVSAGCANCYAEKMAFRLAMMGKPEYMKVTRHHGGQAPKWNGQTAFVESQLEKPLHWKKPRMCFVCSMGDLFHESVPFEWIDMVFAVMALCPQHTFQILTKRPDRMAEYMEALYGDGGHRCIEWDDGTGTPAVPNDFEVPLPNVWLGVTAENQEMANMRISVLLQIPAAKRFVSVEPMLGPIDFYITRTSSGPCAHPGCFAHVTHPCEQCGRKARKAFVGLDWVIVGCESLGGGTASVCGFDDEAGWWEAAYEIYQQCQMSRVPFFFKQGPINGKVIKPDKSPEKVPAWARTQQWPEK